MILFVCQFHTSIYIFYLIRILGKTHKKVGVNNCQCKIPTSELTDNNVKVCIVEIADVHASKRFATFIDKQTIVVCLL